MIICKYHTQDVWRACKTEFAVRCQKKVRVDREAVGMVRDGKLSLDLELVR